MRTERLDGASGETSKFSPAAPSLPFEATPGAEISFEPDLVELSFDPEAAAGLDAFARDQNAGVSAVLLACWQILLARLTGQAEILIGYGSDGRQYDELHAPLGLFARWLPLVCSIDPDASIVQILRQSTEAIRSAIKWQEYFSWEQLEAAEERAPPRPPSR